MKLAGFTKQESLEMFGYFVDCDELADKILKPREKRKGNPQPCGISLGYNKSEKLTEEYKMRLRYDLIVNNLSVANAALKYGIKRQTIYQSSLYRQLKPKNLKKFLEKCKELNL